MVVVTTGAVVVVTTGAVVVVTTGAVVVVTTGAVVVQANQWLRSGTLPPLFNGDRMLATGGLYTLYPLPPLSTTAWNTTPEAMLLIETYLLPTTVAVNNAVTSTLVTMLPLYCTEPGKPTCAQVVPLPSWATGLVMAVAVGPTSRPSAANTAPAPTRTAATFEILMMGPSSIRHLELYSCITESDIGRAAH